MAATKGQDANDASSSCPWAKRPGSTASTSPSGACRGLDVLRAIEERGSAHGRTRGVVVVSQRNSSVVLLRSVVWNLLADVRH